MKQKELTKTSMVILNWKKHFIFYSLYKKIFQRSRFVPHSFKG